MKIQSLVWKLCRNTGQWQETQDAEWVLQSGAGCTYEAHTVERRSQLLVEQGGLQRGGIWDDLGGRCYSFRLRCPDRLMFECSNPSYGTILRLWSL